MKSMRIIAPALVAVCLLVVPLAWSQGGNVEQQIAGGTISLCSAKPHPITASSRSSAAFYEAEGTISLAC